MRLIGKISRAGPQLANLNLGQLSKRASEIVPVPLGHTARRFQGKFLEAALLGIS
jgi:hypothetical protein